MTPVVPEEGVTVTPRESAPAPRDEVTAQIARVAPRTPVVLWVTLGIAIGMVAMLALLQV